MEKQIIGDATLYLGDSLEILPTLDKVDAVVTDPPYFKVKNHEWDRQWKKPQDFLLWLGNVLDECSAIMQHWASIYCFASPEMSWHVEGLLRERFVFLNSIRWKKKEGWHNKQPDDELRIFQRNWEACIFCQKSDDDESVSGYDDVCKKLHRKVYAPIGDYFLSERLAAGLSYSSIAKHINRDNALYLRWEEGSSLPNKSDYEKCQELFNEYLRKDYEELRKDYEELRKDYEELRRPFNLYDTRMRGDIWEYQCVAGYDGKHPCEKPIQVMEHMIGTSTKCGHVVVDPFMGSGTTGVACMNLDRKFIGIEIERKYFDIACERIEAAQAQQRLAI